MKRLVVVCFISLLTMGAGLVAQEKDKATHDAIRQVKDKMVAALNAKNIDALLKHMHDEMSFTTIDGKICRGKTEIRKYFEEIIGKDGLIKEMTINPTVDKLTQLYGGDAGVAYGFSDDSFTLRAGSEISLKSRWSATMVKENGQWLLANFQVSLNAFDNPVLDKAKSFAYIIAAIAALLGLALGFFIGRKTA